VLPQRLLYGRLVLPLEGVFGADFLPGFQRAFAARTPQSADDLLLKFFGNLMIHQQVTKVRGTAKYPEGYLAVFP
jgi:hypothetical protein